MPRSLNIKDINREYYVVDNIKEFSDNINKYHLTGVSINEEKGCFFRINDLLREQFKNFNKKFQ